MMTSTELSSPRIAGGVRAVLRVGVDLELAALDVDDPVGRDTAACIGRGQGPIEVEVVPPRDLDD